MTEVLPDWVLATDPSSVNWESLEVQAAYSSPGYSIGEKSTDYVAIHHMNARAKAFWLPKFLNYIVERAPRFSYHFEVFLWCLSDNNFHSEMMKVLSADDVVNVNNFLDWLGRQSDFFENATSRQLQLKKATQMWIIQH